MLRTIFASLVFLWSSHASAQQLYLGEQATFRSFACDELGQITFVLDAARDLGMEEAGRRANLLMNTPNANGEAACVNAAMQVVVIRVVQTYENLDIGGPTNTIRIIEVMNGAGTIFYTISTIPVIHRPARGA